MTPRRWRRCKRRTLQCRSGWTITAWWFALGAGAGHGDRALFTVTPFALLLCSRSVDGDGFNGDTMQVVPIEFYEVRGHASAGCG